MPEVSDKEVEKARARVDKLRADVAEAQAELFQQENSRTNEVDKAVLDAEAQRLENLLAEAKERLKDSRSADLPVGQFDGAGEVVDTTPDPNLEPTPSPLPGDSTKATTKKER